MSLDSTQKCRAWSLLDQAFGLPTEQREAFVHETCSDDPQLAEWVLKALEHDASVPASDPAATSSSYGEGSSGGSPRTGHGVLIGQVLGGRYRIQEWVQDGGMGAVFRAEHIELGNTVAIKVLHTQRDPDALLAEGRRIAELQHTHVVRVLDVGVHEQLPYLVLEWLDGFDLRQWLQAYYSTANHEEAHLDGLISSHMEGIAGETLPGRWSTGSYWRFVATTMRDAARAIAHAHDSSIAHQDISPKNIVVTRGGRAAVIDFGLAALIHERWHGQQAFGGTLPYMAPEHRRSREGHHLESNDIYGLGATLLHLLSGVSPDRVALPKRGLRKANIYFGGVARRDRAVPLDLLRVAAKATHVDPVKRYSSARAVADDLDHFLSYRPVSAGAPRLTRRLRLWGRRHPVLTASFLVPLLLFGALAGRNKVHAYYEHHHRIEFAQQHATLPAFYTLMFDAEKAPEEADVADERVGATLDRMLTLQPQLASLRIRRMLNASRRGEFDVVSKHIKVLENSHGPSGVLKLLKPSLSSEDAATRLRLVNPQDLGQADSYQDHLLCSNLCVAYGQFGKAIEHARAALLVREDDWVTANLGAAASLWLNRNAEAREFLQKAAGSSPWISSCTQLHMRALLYDGDDEEEPIRMWDLALSNCPDQPPVLINLLSYRTDGARFSSIEEAKLGAPAAFEVFDSIRAISPDSAQAYAAILRLCRFTQDYDRAEEVLSFAKSEVPSLKGNGKRAKRLEYQAAYHLLHAQRQALLNHGSIPLSPADLTGWLEEWDGLSLLDGNPEALLDRFGDHETRSGEHELLTLSARSQVILLRWCLKELEDHVALELLAELIADCTEARGRAVPLVYEVQTWILREPAAPSALQVEQLRESTGQASKLLDIELRLPPEARMPRLP